MADNQPAPETPETEDLSIESAADAVRELPDAPEDHEIEAPDPEAPSDETASQEATEAEEATETEETEAEPDEPDEVEAEPEEEAETEDEPETPAIDPPASMSAAEKQAFAKLPSEQQEFIARREREVAEGFTRKSQELADSQRQFQQKLQQTQDAAHQAVAQRDRQYQEALQVLDVQMANTVKVYSQDELSKLREDDPTQWALANEHNRQVKDTQAAIRNELARRDQEQRQQFEQARQQYLDDNRRKLPELIPEWSDAETARSEGAKLSQYLTAQAGFTPQEVENNADARLLTMARKAWLYDQLQADKPRLKEKVREAPKTVKPNAPTRKAPGDARLDQLRARSRKSGSMRDAAALIAAQS